MIKKRWDDVHPYTRGYTFWSKNPFWRDPTRKFSAKSIAYYERWLDDLRTGEKQLTRLQ